MEDQNAGRASVVRCYEVSRLEAEFWIEAYHRIAPSRSGSLNAERTDDSVESEQAVRKEFARGA